MKVNKILYRFQDDITCRIDQARAEGLTIVEIVGALEAIKAKMWNITFARARALDQDPDLSQEKAQAFVNSILKSRQ